MTKLSTAQNKEVIRLINRKELTSSEIISEIYDHYLCHLERFDESQFEEHLNELEEKFTLGYCHALQSNFAGNFRKELRRLHWDIIKSYFYFPKLIYTLISFIILVAITFSVAEKNSSIILIYTPIFIIFGSGGILLYRNYKKLKTIRCVFSNQRTTISSTVDQLFVVYLIFPALVANGVFQLVNTFSEIHFTTYQSFPYISLAIITTLCLYCIPLIEIWRIKGKYL